MHQRRVEKPELCHSVSLGLVHLLLKGSYLCRQISLRFLCLLPKVGLLRQLSKCGRQLLVEGTDDLLVLISLFVLNLLTLAESTDHPLVGHAFVLECSHSHQRLK